MAKLTKKQQAAYVQSENVIKKIDQYRATKDDTMLDAFYHTDLDFMITAIEHYRDWVCAPMDEAQEAETPDMLKTMMQMQKDLQKFLGTDFDGPMSMKERTFFIKEHSIHLNQEINEALYELPFFKPWKNYEGMTEDEFCVQRAKFVEEMVDAWHFYMNMMLAWNITPKEFYNGYMKKNAENYERQKRGYTHDVSYRK